ncbi:HNH endonuclease [Rhodococcus maanshanensis]|uniref:HNH endonuclease n=1 Tax=Rhodococcus maanshanensis TaxID=183556 RepID=A0A1H7SCM7_9NOCA|nr:HNH endonuclease [Rhodococcus maanshanensis]
MERHLAALDAAVEGLLTDPLTGLSEADVVKAVQRMETSLRKASAVGHRLIIESVERSIPGNLACRSINDFLVSTLRISAADAAKRVKGATKVGSWHTVGGEAMEATLPTTASAVREGAIGPDHLAAIARTLRQIPHGTTADVIDVAERILSDAARSTTPEDVTKVGIHLLAHLHPDGSVPDERERKRRRGLRLGKQGADLMTPVSGLLDPETRALLEPVLAKLARPGMNNPDDPESPSGDLDSPDLDRTALAKAASRDTRTAVQRNHDGLKVALQQMLSSGILGSHRGLPVTAIITLTIGQLEKAAGVATTATGGIVPISDALRMAQSAHPVLALFDHNGRPLHLGRSRRLASSDQRLALIAASRGCTRPGCDAPASLTAVHHITEWQHGGATDITNEDLACDSCHALVHDGPGGWKTRVAPPGSAHPGRTEWIAPPYIDPGRKPRVNHRHHLDHLVAGALNRRRIRRARPNRRSPAEVTDRAMTRPDLEL